VRVFEKQPKAKTAEGVAQMVEHLPSKHRTWSLNSSTEKKKKIKNRVSMSPSNFTSESISQITENNLKEIFIYL
jgi:hypothetical protein